MTNLELVSTASNILENYLKVKMGEKVLLINDHEPNPVYDAFKLALASRGAEAKEITLSEKRKPSEPIPQCLGDLEWADVIIAPTKQSVTHCPETRKAEEGGARIITLPGITGEIFLKVQKADFNGIWKMEEHLLSNLKGKESITIKTGSGTDISFSVKGRPWESSKPDYLKGFVHNLPTGEVFCAPVEDSANGKIAIDYWKDILKPKNKAWLIVKNGKIIEWNEAAKPFIEHQSAENGLIIAEFGIGTNKAHKKPVGNILHDEKIYGSCHIAFGNNTSFGGKNASAVHSDIILMKPKIAADGKALKW